MLSEHIRQKCQWLFLTATQKGEVKKQSSYRGGDALLFKYGALKGHYVVLEKKLNLRILIIWSPEHCLTLERWQGPPHNKYLRAVSLFLSSRVCLFSSFRHKKQNSATEDLPLLITIFCPKLHSAFKNDRNCCAVNDKKTAGGRFSNTGLLFFFFFFFTSPAAQSQCQ